MNHCTYGPKNTPTLACANTLLEFVVRAKSGSQVGTPLTAAPQGVLPFVPVGVVFLLDESSRLA